MAENTFKNVAVIGAGTMGHGIAQVCAMAGMEVCIFDVQDTSLQVGLDK
ncbi:MAG: 3-hydroxyacyl-CoA dehydrogenase NAD-binding domain-containing protein, partial [Myxococcota bacterium]